MTLYGKFKKLDIDFSQLGLEQDDTRSGYFCTPKGARVIGWEGVDGIHKAPERPEWKVYFANGFGNYHVGHDRQGKEIPVNKTFTWGGKVWHIPAVYSCGQGMVVDLCMEIELAELRAFIEKWRQLIESGGELTTEELERQNAENPMTANYEPRLTVNGRELRRRSGNGFGWTPVSCRPEEERGEPSRQDWESLWLMEHYGLDVRKGWMFWRDSFPWVTKKRPVLKTVSLSLAACPVSIPGPQFTVSGVGDMVELVHPVTGKSHTLHVVEYETQKLDASRFHDADKWEYPTYYTVMSYAVDPELPRGELTVRDCGEGDRPRIRQLEPAGPTAANSVAIILANGKTDRPCAACSSLYFEVPEQIEWRIVFYQKTVGDIKLNLPLPQN